LIRINLDIQAFNWHLKDSFLWDLSNKDNVPEEFAAVLAEDLELPPLFEGLIALQIRRQISVHLLRNLKRFKENAESL